MKQKNLINISRSVFIVFMMMTGLTTIAYAEDPIYTGCLSVVPKGTFYFFQNGTSPLDTCKSGDTQTSFYDASFIDVLSSRVDALEAKIDNPENLAITTSHGNITLGQLAEIQPGLGTVMTEYATRFWSMFYAANAGNWGLAAFQMKEALEIQEVGETTRPEHAEDLKAFESKFLVPLNDTINAQDFGAFQQAYNNTVEGCNDCHADHGLSFIKYALPASPPNIP